MLAAGLGTRLRPVTHAIPKPMVPVLNRPVMEHTARLLAAPWLHRDDRQPALVPGDDRGPLRRRLRLRPRALLQPRGEAAGNRRRGPQGRRLPRRLVPGRRRRRAHRPRLRRDAGVPRIPRRPRDARHQAGRRHRPVRGRDRRRRRPDPGLPGEARPGRGALRPCQHLHLHVSLRRSSSSSPRRGPARPPAPTTSPASRTGRWTSSRPCSRPTSPSTRTRSTPTGTTSATSTSCRQGNVDALRGAVAVEPGAPEVAAGVGCGQLPDGAEVEAPALIGAGVELGEGARIVGPASSATAARSAPVPTCATRSCSTAPSVPAGSMLVGGIAGPASRSPDAS